MNSVFNAAKLVLAVGLCAGLLSACGGSGGVNFPHVVKFKPAQVDSPYKDVLVPCLRPATSAALCKLSVLPYIGQATSNPTKADILAHTISTHPWMATRFGELLDKMPNDMLLLFKGVTGVAIGAKIRPSYYDPSTGAIYLDPADLWLSNAERSTISRTPDYRSEFGSELEFATLWRYVKGDVYAWDDYPLDGTFYPRTLEQILIPMAQLLFHELAHANDFMPPALVAQVDPQSLPESRATTFESSTVSVGLTNSMPLNSIVMFDLGKVLFQGVAATTAQKQLSAAQVGLEFAVDGASDAYAYSSQWEDTAMLFEEVMMKYHFNVDRDIAYTDAPATFSCSAYVVRWGVRNRIGDETVKARAKIIVQQLLGRSDVEDYFSAIPAPRTMQNGLDWCVNIKGLSSAYGPELQKVSNQQIRASDLRHPH